MKHPCIYFFFSDFTASSCHGFSHNCRFEFKQDISSVQHVFWTFALFWEFIKFFLWWWVLLNHLLVRCSHKTDYEKKKIPGWGSLHEMTNAFKSDHFQCAWVVKWYIGVLRSQTYLLLPLAPAPLFLLDFGFSSSSGSSSSCMLPLKKYVTVLVQKNVLTT